MYFSIAAKNMGYQITLLDPNESCPASKYSDLHIKSDFNDEEVKDRIIQTIEIFEPRAVVLNVSTNLRETTNEVKVTVTFRVVNSNETVTTELNLTRLR